MWITLIDSLNELLVGSSSKALVVEQRSSKFDQQGALLHLGALLFLGAVDFVQTIIYSLFLDIVNFLVTLVYLEVFHQLSWM